MPLKYHQFHKKALLLRLPLSSQDMQTPACLLHTLFRRRSCICWGGADETPPLPQHRAEPSSFQDVRNIWNSPSPLLSYCTLTAQHLCPHICIEEHVGCAHTALANPPAWVPREPLLRHCLLLFWLVPFPGNRSSPSPWYHLPFRKPTATLKPTTGRIRKKGLQG